MSRISFCNSTEKANTYTQIHITDVQGAAEKRAIIETKIIHCVFTKL